MSEGIKVIATAGRADTLDRAARIRLSVRDSLDMGQLTVSEQSGRYIAAAVEWCEEKGVPYTIEAVPGALYTLHVEEVTPEMDVRKDTATMFVMEPK